MQQLPTLVKMLESGLHFGHKRSRRYPKMEPFIFTTKNDINIIDLRLTTEYLERALAQVHNLGQIGATVLFVGTKKQASPLVVKYASACNQPYVASRWIGGTLTNFAIISKMIKKYWNLTGQRDSGELEKYTKKEQLDIVREIEELEDLIGGIKNLSKLPHALFVVDIHHDATAVKEARKKGLPIIALCDTNVNPELINYPIPANDDAVKGLDLILDLVSKSYLEGAAKKKADQEREEAKKHGTEKAVEL
jgi:small subunit ribosomal protein S2